MTLPYCMPRRGGSLTRPAMRSIATTEGRSYLLSYPMRPIHASLPATDSPSTHVVGAPNAVIPNAMGR